ncbi:MAG TPA: AAA family ATPase [Acidobacteriota bacterium]|nr:AAA family ATPase [Acidobacteriota bacterium]
MARIIPVSSGKGGVGKTTFAIHYALVLARFGRTILIDLDFGTSSVRNSIDVPVPYDLYHFFRKNVPLQSCVTPLSDRLDPQNRFRNFGFIASPKGLIEDLMNFDESQKARLIRSINSLQADYIVLDLKAGVDARVLDFLPHANTGVIVFTPLVPSAIFAASEMVKHLILRKLKAMFHFESFLLRSGVTHEQIGKYLGHIESMEDVYEAKERNLEEFLSLLQLEIENETVLAMLGNVIRDFKIYYVLNRFNSVTDSVEKIIKPFTKSIHDAISPYLRMINLGWIVEDDRFLKSAAQRIPLLLQQPPEPSQKQDTRKMETNMLNQWMAELKREFAPLPKPVRAFSPAPAVAAPKISTSKDPLEQQLNLLKAMFVNQDRKDFKLNFDYITQRSLHLMRHGRFDDFGDVKLFATLQDRAEAISARWH